MQLLKGKIAVITGAASARGLGKATAQMMSDHGAKIAILDLDQSAAAAAAADIGAEHIGLACDVTDQAACAAAVKTVTEKLGAIDILVNNAGMQHRAPLEDFPADAFDRLMRTNVNSVFYVAQAVARHMIARGKGRIINIASVQTALARPSIAPYTASKGAVANLTKGMATDWAKYGLNCNAIAPGYFNTPLNAALVADPEFSAWLEKRTPAGRWGEVDELVGACVFLSAEASSFVNGHTLFVDGGITASL